MKKYFKRCFSLFILALVIQGCKKEKEEDFDTQSSQDNAQAESIMNEINEITDQAVEDGELTTHRFGDATGNLLSLCGTIDITIDSTDGSGNATIDFGAHFCQGLDLKYRKGIIAVNFSGPYKNPGTNITITATNYFVGYDSLYATKVNGQRSITNNGINSSGNLSFSITANLTLINYLSQILTWQSNRTREWISGDSTVTRADDEYQITGSASGTSFAGVNFSANIIEPLHVKLNCRFITSGTFSLTPENKPARILDYGDGSCDGNATVTIEEKVFNITLR